MCDNKGPTLTVARSTNGYLFGGYNPLPCDSTSVNKQPKEAFIFTLFSPHYPPNFLPVQMEYLLLIQFTAMHHMDQYLVRGMIFTLTPTQTKRTMGATSISHTVTLTQPILERPYSLELKNLPPMKLKYILLFDND